MAVRWDTESHNKESMKKDNRTRIMERRARSTAALLMVSALMVAPLVLPACSRPADRPNVLFVVWDTVRADRLSVYGCDTPTTPFLEAFARGARVYDNCTSTGSSTVPSHGAMFTGLLPREHGANNSFKHLADAHATLAEIFRDSGYATYLFSANPHISADENFSQGFDVEEHPWDDRYRERALGMIRQKANPLDANTDLNRMLRVNRPDNWYIKNCGKLAEHGLLDWLGKKPEGRPYFAFLNYMEAHQPYAPPIEIRSRLMTPAQLERSAQIDRSWINMWCYTFGLHDYSAADLEILARLYDACLIELDGLFEELIASLDAGGYLDNTIVVLVGDHGEHLGEHHMLDHQYSLYEPLLRVPLIVRYPEKIEAGRETRPVVNFDLFPTLLELAGLEPPSGPSRHALSLLDADADRLRLAEYPSDLDQPIEKVKKIYSRWDPTPFRRRMTALYDGAFKYIHASDGTHELYDLSVDPGETRNLIVTEGADRKRFHETLKRLLNETVPFDYAGADGPDLSDEQIERLRSLGYGGGRR